MAERLPDRDVHVHLVGAGGAGMSGLAKILAQMGYAVSGSDLKRSRALELLTDVGVETWVGHRPDRAGTWGLVVASSAVPERDPELVAARRLGIPIWRRPRLLGALTAAMPTVGLAGTHGKTTSTGLMVAALRGVGLDPSFLLGGELVEDNTGAHLGTDDPFVLEADEAFGTFRHLRLVGLLVTNVEADHLDYYGTVAAVEDAFAQVAASVDGPVVGCVDDPGVRRLARRVPVVSYGTSRDATWRIADVRNDPEGVRFRLEGPVTTEVTVPRPGIHVARNATGVLALVAAMGWDIGLAVEGVARFGGIRRRWEIRGRAAGVTVVEDYAHHPTEIAATVAAARLVGDGRVWAIFQPHRYTRTADLGPAFGTPLAGADRVVVTDVFSAGERPIPGVTGRIVADAVAAAGGRVEYVPSLDAVPEEIIPELHPGDVVLLLGAGDVGTLTGRIVAALEER